MSIKFLAAVWSLSTLDLLPDDDAMVPVDTIGEFTLYEGKDGLIALNAEAEEPADWSVGMTGPGWVPTILHCGDDDGTKHILRRCMRYVVDHRTGETSCIPCWRDTLALEEGA